MFCDAVENALRNQPESDHAISPLLMPSPENKWLMYVLCPGAFGVK